VEGVIAMLFLYIFLRLMGQEYSENEIKELETICQEGTDSERRGPYCRALGELATQSGKYDLSVSYYTKGCLYEDQISCSRLREDNGYYSPVYQKELFNLCQEGNSESCYQLGVQSEGRRQLESAKAYFKKACESGIKSACLRANYSDSKILFYGAIILIGLACFIITRTIFLDEDQYKASETLEEADKSTASLNHGLILKYSRPFFKRYISPVVSSLKGKDKIKEKYRRKLASAGLSSYLTTDDFYAFKIFLILGFPIFFLFIRSFLGEDWPLKMVFPLGIIGFFYPDFWIKGKIQARQRHIVLEMPFIVDMLALSVEAGLDFVAGISKILEKAKKGPLLDEFRTLLKEIKIGASRAEALRNMAWRIDLIQVSSFCATLIAADSVGASIGPILKALSNEIRVKRSAEVEKAGATAATKILLPMIFFIIPAVFLVVLGPILIQAFTGS
jgi:tight adherence protein C